MKEREYILSLYELYKNLLNQKERSYFEYYYFEDYSLQEISDNQGVSRAYVSKLINSIENKLTKYESSLNLYDRNNKIRKIVDGLDIKDKIEELL